MSARCDSEIAKDGYVVRMITLKVENCMEKKRINGLPVVCRCMIRARLLHIISFADGLTSKCHHVLFFSYLKMCFSSGCPNADSLMRMAADIAATSNNRVVFHCEFVTLLQINDFA